MKRIAVLLALLLLAQCKTFHLPKPGDPVRPDIDERAALRDALREENESPHYDDTKLQQAFENGYSAGFLDHWRGKISDPEASAGSIPQAQRAAFTAGYLAGFAK